MSEMQRILAAAVHHNRSLYHVAQLCHVAYSTAHRWKKGQAAPQGRNLLKLIKLGTKSLLLLLLTAGAFFFRADEARADVRPAFDRSIHYTKWRNRLRALLSYGCTC